MASLYQRPRSPFWWIYYVDKEGEEVWESTKLRYDDPRENAAAHTLKAKVEEKEVAHRLPSAGRDAWEAWVPGFLETHCRSPKTLENYLDRWKWLALFFARHGIKRPSEVKHRHAAEYVAWRMAWKKRNTRKQVKKNTALMDLRLFSLIMRKAVLLEFCQTNAIEKHGIPRDDPKEKPEVTDEEFARIRAALVDEDDWMRDSFEIAAATGCRLRETMIAMKDIDLRRGTITFRPKGGAGKIFTAPMPKVLRPLFERMRADGRKITLSMPEQPSRVWRRVFEKAGCSHLSFHCLRVTYVTRLCRESVPQSAAMRLVNHSSTVVHRIYQRLGVEDVRRYADVASNRDDAGAKA